VLALTARGYRQFVLLLAIVSRIRLAENHADLPVQPNEEQGRGG
jgi:hypothetical protein